MYHPPKHIHWKNEPHTSMWVLFFFQNVPKVFDKKTSSKHSNSTQILMEENPPSSEVPTLDAMALTTSAFSVSFSAGGDPGSVGLPVFFSVSSRKDWDMQGGPMLCYKWSYNPYKWPYKWVTGIILTLPIGGYNSIYNWLGAHLVGMPCIFSLADEDSLIWISL